MRAAAKSVFHFDVPGSVAKSTHAGIPGLLFLLKSEGDRVHFWPFDGWKVPPGKSAVVEVYPALWSRFFSPSLTEEETKTAEIEGWILGIA